MKHELVQLSVLAAVLTGASAFAEQSTLENGQAGQKRTYIVRSKSGAEAALTVPVGLDVSELLRDAQVVHEVSPESSVWTGVRSENL